MDLYNKKVGKVYDYDGEAGTIVTQEEEYTFFKRELHTPNEDIINKPVSFYSSTVPFGNETFKVARDIKVLRKEQKPQEKGTTR